jgi:hypothetical protein
MVKYFSVLKAFYQMGGRHELAGEAVKLFNRQYRDEWADCIDYDAWADAVEAERDDIDMCDY